MISVSNIKIELYNQTSEHIFYSQPESNCLTVIFPGGNNSTKTPILHYCRKHLLENHSDFLSISYKNLIVSEDSDEVKLEKVISAVYEAIKKVQEGKNYTKKVFISRSFGNIVSNEIKIKESITADKCIYIAPTDEAVKYFETYPGLIITGTKDSYLPVEQVNIIKEKYKDDVLVFENGNHSIESDDMSDTLDFCKKAVLKIIDYLEM